MKRNPAFLAFLALLVFAVLNVEAQNDKAPGTGINATFARLFGVHKVFTTSVSVLVAGKQKTTMSMELAMMENQMRVEVELANIRVDGQPQPGIETFKNLGLDRIITISRLDQKTSFVIVPGMKATVETPMPEDEAASLDGEAKVEKAELGKQTIEGHPCTRSQFVITDKKGRKREGVVWNATDLKDFPVQMQMVEGDSQVILRFRNVQFQAPDAKLFVSPPGYKAYGSMSELTGAAMARMQKGRKN